MPRPSVTSGTEVIRVFERAGWEVSRREGSHVILTRAGMPVTLSVPDHREVRRGTLRSLIRKAGMNVDEFALLLRG